MPDEFNKKDVRAAVETLHANRLICECGQDGEWGMDLNAGCWVCPKCGAQYDGNTTKKR